MSAEIFGFIVRGFILVFLLACLTATVRLWLANRRSLGAIILNLFMVPIIGFYIYRVISVPIDLSLNQDYMPRFGIDHFIYLGTAVALIYYLFMNRQQIRHNPRPYYRFFFLTLLFQQIGLYIWYYLALDFDLSLSLPMHFSRVTSIFILLHFIFKNAFWSQLAFYWGIYSIGTFAWPTDLNGLDHILGWSFLISHLVTLVFPLLLYFGEGWQPKRSNLHLAYLVFLIYMPITHWVNEVTGGNYFYLVNRPFLNDLPYGQYLTLVIIATYLIFWIGYGLFYLVLQGLEASEKKRRSTS